MRVGRCRNTHSSEKWKINITFGDYEAECKGLSCRPIILIKVEQYLNIFRGYANDARVHILR